MKEKLKSLAPWLVAIVLGVFLVGGLAKASGGFSWDVVMDKVADKLVAQIENLGNMLGASGTRFPNGISADSTSPSAGQVRGTTLTATGAATAGSLTSSGDTRATSLVQAGTIATFTATSSATAANVCDSRHWIVTPASTTPTITLPSTTTLFADCMTTNGDVLEVSIATVTTSTILVAGTGGNADLSSTLTITADKSALLRFIRDSATTYLLQVINTNS